MSDPSATETTVLDYRAPATPPDGRPRPRVRTLGEELAKLGCLAVIYLWYGLQGDQDKGADLFFYAALLLWGYIVVRAIDVSLRADDGDAPADPRRVIKPRWRAAIVWVAAMSLLMTVVVSDGYSCGHGWRRANNQIGVAWSNNGGPCGNGPHPRIRSLTWHVGGNWYLYVPSDW